MAIEGAEATLGLPGEDNPDLTALLAKAAAGKAALTAAKHCQQVLGGIGFTDEHDLQPPCEAGAGARRIARQLKGTHPQGRSGPAGPRLGPAPRQPLRSPSSASVRVCTSTRRISPAVDARSRSCAGVHRALFIHRSAAPPTTACRQLSRFRHGCGLTKVVRRSRRSSHKRSNPRSRLEISLRGSPENALPGEDLARRLLHR